MPEPSKGETMNSWMSKCVPTFLNENKGAETNQAVAACLSMAREKGVSGAPEKK